MQQRLVDAEFYQTYFLANAVMNVVHRPASYLRNLEAFCGDGRVTRFAEPFPRYSALHTLVEYLYEEILFEDLFEGDADHRGIQHRLRSGLLRANKALDHHGIPHRTFGEWAAETALEANEPSIDDAIEYVRELFDAGPLESLMSRTVEEVFFVVFANRLLLKSFNEMVAGEMSRVSRDEMDPEPRQRFKADGVLRRAHIPKWTKNAVFHRERGCCALCRRDISGLGSISSRENYDHIVPLALGGLNDVSNLQLLCESCNQRKSAGAAITSTYYEAWY